MNSNKLLQNAMKKLIKKKKITKKQKKKLKPKTQIL